MGGAEAVGSLVQIEIVCLCLYQYRSGRRGQSADNDCGKGLGGEIDLDDAMFPDISGTDNV